MQNCAAMPQCTARPAVLAAAPRRAAVPPASARRALPAAAACGRATARLSVALRPAGRAARVRRAIVAVRRPTGHTLGLSTSEAAFGCSLRRAAPSLTAFQPAWQAAKDGDDEEAAAEGEASAERCVAGARVAGAAAAHEHARGCRRRPARPRCVQARPNDAAASCSAAGGVSGACAARCFSWLSHVLPAVASARARAVCAALATTTTSPRRRRRWTA